MFPEGYYLNSIPGNLVRTPHGDIAFLTKSEGRFRVLKKNKTLLNQLAKFQSLYKKLSDLELKKKEELANISYITYKIPSFSLLFLKNGANVLKNQILVQYSSLSEQKSQREEVEQQLYSKLCGEIYYSHIDVQEFSNDEEFLEFSLESWDWGYLWILSGKIYQLTNGGSIFPNYGDFVGYKNSFSRYKWKISKKLFFNKWNFPFPQKKYNHKLSDQCFVINRYDSASPKNHLLRNQIASRYFFTSRCHSAKAPQCQAMRTSKAIDEYINVFCKNNFSNFLKIKKDFIQNLIYNPQLKKQNNFSTKWSFLINQRFLFVKTTLIFYNQIAYFIVPHLKKENHCFAILKNIKLVQNECFFYNIYPNKIIKFKEGNNVYDMQVYWNFKKVLNTNILKYFHCSCFAINRLTCHKFIEKDKKFLLNEKNNLLEKFFLPVSLENIHWTFLKKNYNTYNWSPQPSHFVKYMPEKFGQIQTGIIFYERQLNYLKNIHFDNKKIVDLLFNKSSKCSYINSILEKESVTNQLNLFNNKFGIFKNFCKLFGCKATNNSELIKKKKFFKNLVSGYVDNIYLKIQILLVPKDFYKIYSIYKNFFILGNANYSTLYNDRNSNKKKKNLRYIPSRSKHYLEYNKYSASAPTSFKLSCFALNGKKNQSVLLQSNKYSNSNYFNISNIFYFHRFLFNCSYSFFYNFFYKNLDNKNSLFFMFTKFELFWKDKTIPLFCKINRQGFYKPISINNKKWIKTCSSTIYKNKYYFYKYLCFDFFLLPNLNRDYFYKKNFNKQMIERSKERKLTNFRCNKFLVKTPCFYSKYYSDFLDKKLNFLKLQHVSCLKYLKSFFIRKLPLNKKMYLFLFNLQVKNLDLSLYPYFYNIENINISSYIFETIIRRKKRYNTLFNKNFSKKTLYSKKCSTDVPHFKQYLIFQYLDNKKLGINEFLIFKIFVSPKVKENFFSVFLSEIINMSYIWYIFFYFNKVFFADFSFVLKLCSFSLEHVLFKYYGKIKTIFQMFNTTLPIYGKTSILPNSNKNNNNFKAYCLSGKCEAKSTHQMRVLDSQNCFTRIPQTEGIQKNLYPYVARQRLLLKTKRLQKLLTPFINISESSSNHIKNFYLFPKFSFKNLQTLFYGPFRFLSFFKVIFQYSKKGSKIVKLLMTNNKLSFSCNKFQYIKKKALPLFNNVFLKKLSFSCNKYFVKQKLYMLYRQNDTTQQQNKNTKTKMFFSNDWYKKKINYKIMNNWLKIRSTLFCNQSNNELFKNIQSNYSKFTNIKKKFIKIKKWNLELQSGWVYISDINSKVVENRKRKLIDLGKFFIDDLTFLNFVHLEAFFKKKRSSQFMNSNKICFFDNLLWIKNKKVKFKPILFFYFLYSKQIIKKTNLFFIQKTKEYWINYSKISNQLLKKIDGKLDLVKNLSLLYYSFYSDKLNKQRASAELISHISSSKIQTQFIFKFFKTFTKAKLFINKKNIFIFHIILKLNNTFFSNFQTPFFLFNYSKVCHTLFRNHINKIEQIIFSLLYQLKFFNESQLKIQQNKLPNSILKNLFITKLIFIFNVPCLELCNSYNFDSYFNDFVDNVYIVKRNKKLKKTKLLINNPYLFLTEQEDIGFTEDLSPFRGEFLRTPVKKWNSFEKRNKALLLTKNDVFSFSFNFTNSHQITQTKESFNEINNGNREKQKQTTRMIKQDDIISLNNDVSKYLHFVRNDCTNNVDNPTDVHFNGLSNLFNEGVYISTDNNFDQNALKNKNIHLNTNNINRENFFLRIFNKIYKISGLGIGYFFKIRGISLGQFVTYGTKIIKNKYNYIHALHHPGMSTNGRIIHIGLKKITLRKGEQILVSSEGILQVQHGDLVENKVSLIILPYKKLKTSDIIQGIPKVEQIFEARITREGRPFLESLPSILSTFYTRYRFFYSFFQAVRLSLYKIQKVILNGIQKVYRSQGVGISDKHFEIIIRQMTNKVFILPSRQRFFIPGEIMDLQIAEKIHKLLIPPIYYEPIVCGISRTSLLSLSFLSAASFQQSSRMLAAAAISTRKDKLIGLKENIMIGNIMPAGTGYFS